MQSRYARSHITAHNMEKSVMNKNKKQLLFFFTCFITGTLVGYLFHDLKDGVTTGIVIGIISVIFVYKYN